MNTKLANKYDELISSLKGYKRAAVGFSGGVDSTFLLMVCREALGKNNTLAITADSPMFSKTECDESIAFCKSYDIRQDFVPMQWDDIKPFVHNPPDRCYLCKHVIFRKIINAARAADIQIVLDGTNADDCLDYRPGNKALEELGVKSPLRDAGLTKEDIRILSKQHGLVTWEKPALACLASRIPYGDEITPQKLVCISKAEEGLRKFGLTQVRVRCHGDSGRIEVPPEERIKFCSEYVMDQAAAILLNAGFRFASLDLTGYKMGNLNP